MDTQYSSPTSRLSITPARSESDEQAASSPDSAPNSPYCLQEIPNAELLSRLKGLVGRSNQLTAHVLAHLAEVDARRIYREHACSSLYAYCVYELRMSEDEAQRRIVAARTARRFPVLFEMLESAAIHLTGILLLAPHLNDDNCTDLLARARFRTKKEIQKLVAEIAPEPDVPARIEPLAPGPSRHRPTWSAYVASLAGPVRDIPPGNGRGEAPTATGSVDASCDDSTQRAAGVPGISTFDDASAPGPAQPITPSDVDPTRGRAEAPRAAYRYKIQFTADQLYVDLLEEARDLLQHVVVDRDLANVHQYAMETLVEKLRKRRRAATDRPRAAAPEPSRESHEAAVASPENPQGRHIPARVVRTVWDRDAGRCTFVDPRGQRCRETAGLELHHDDLYSRGGPSTVDNLRLLCRAHNALEAERQLGRDFVERCKHGRRPTPHARPRGHPRQRG